jgi:hypothetical protein
MINKNRMNQYFKMNLIDKWIKIKLFTNNMKEQILILL